VIFFVTGGSRGLGEAIVLEAAKQGNDVAFTYNKGADAAKKVLARAKDIAPKSKVLAYQCDQRSSANVEEVGDRVLDDFGDMNVVVPNAGININGLAANYDDEDWKTVIDTNLSGSFYVVRHFLGTMVANRFGRIIFVSSLGAYGVTGQSCYATTKAGLMGLSQSLSKEYGRRGITSNVVAPGFFDTDMTREGMSDYNREFWTKYCPLGRIGEPIEVASVVCFLASTGAAFVNGQTINISGGLDWAP
jgi:NAD(P)-dependent dehydrogenase (short-subunit alcohol dehydrogenase family)